MRKIFNMNLRWYIFYSCEFEFVLENEKGIKSVALGSVFNVSILGAPDRDCLDDDFLMVWINGKQSDRICDVKGPILHYVNRIEPAQSSVTIKGVFMTNSRRQGHLPRLMFKQSSTNLRGAKLPMQGKEQA